MNLFRSKIKEEFEALKAQHESTLEELKGLQEMKEKFESLVEENKTLVEEKSQMFDELQTLKGEIVETEKTVEEVIEANVELIKDIQTVDEVATSKTIETLATLGVEAVALVDESKEEPTKKEKTVIETYLSLSGNERTEFYRKNKSKILSGINKISNQ